MDFESAQSMLRGAVSEGATTSAALVALPSH